MKKFLALFLWVLSSNVAKSEVIYDALNFCGEKQFGLLYRCEKLPDAKKVEFKPSGISETENEFIKSLGMVNQISYEFSCSASRPFSFGIAFEGKRFPFTWNKSGQFENTITSESSASSYSLEVLPESTSTAVREGCRVNIINNVSKVEDAPIKAHIASIIKSASAVNKLTRQLANIEVLPSAWSNLLSISEDLDLEIILVESDMSGLDQTSSESLKLNERKDFYLRLKTTISEAIEITDKCETEGVDTSTKALCLESLMAIRKEIENATLESTRELEEISDFARKEKIRLKSLNEAWSKQFETILTLISKTKT